MAGGVRETFDELISSAANIGKFAKATTFSQIGKTYTVLGEGDELLEKVVSETQFLISLDKKTYSELRGRITEYKAIPYIAGGQSMKEVAEYIIEAEDGPVKEAFANEQTPGGRAWPPLADHTVYEKDLLGYGSMPMLQREQDLFAAATDVDLMTEVVVTGKYARLIISGDNIPEDHAKNSLWGKFYTHMYGGGKNNIPPRQFLPMAAEDISTKHRRNITKILKDKTDKVIRAV